jgi:hypothetical protein
MKVYQKIKLGFDPFDELKLDYEDLHHHENPWPLKTVEPKHIGITLIKFLENLNLSPVDRSCFFVGSPSTIQTIHTDVKKGWAINFVKNWEESTMRWFSLRNPTDNPPIKLTNAGTQYQKFSLASLNFVDQGCFECALVKIDIPHQVINRSINKYRYCYSVRVKPMIEWEQALKLFEPWSIK